VQGLDPRFVDWNVQLEMQGNLLLLNQRQMKNKFLNGYNRIPRCIHNQKDYNYNYIHISL
jgi:hypothetical protein